MNNDDDDDATAWRSKRDSSYSETCFQQAKAHCGDQTTCGMRKLYSKLNSVSPKADMIGAYPWVAAVMVEGNEICPGTLIHKQWLLVSSKCIDDNVRYI